MDKYEYQIKSDQIKKLVSKEDYVTAMEVADTIDWRRVRSISMLSLVSDIYEKNEKFEESKEILLLAYERAPIGRMIIYKLVELSLKLKEYEDADEYYKEFVHIAPRDTGHYILKYKIEKNKGAKTEDLISILEEFNQKEYHEKWAYELARLYHEAGVSDKCVDACDQLILWFSDGKYVEKAMDLKKIYKPLSPSQQEKYDRKDEIKEEIEEKTEEKVEEKTETNQHVSAEETAEQQIAIEAKDISPGKYDTINLQEELARSMQQILSAVEKDKVEIRAEDYIKDSVKPVEEDKAEVPSLKGSFEGILTENFDGQIALNIPEETILEKQITGQMNIEEILKEWERARKETAAQKEIEELSDKIEKNSLHQTEDFMKLLSEVLPTMPLDTAEKKEEPEGIKEAEVFDESAATQEAVQLEEIEESGEIEKAEETEEPGEIQESGEMKEPESIDELEELGVLEEPEELEEPESRTEKSSENSSRRENQKKIFEDFFIPPIVDYQIQKILSSYGEPDIENKSARNMLIIGEPGTGRTTLAINMIKAIQMGRNQNSGKIAKITASVLNEKDIFKTIEKILGGTLIIEQASGLSEDTVVNLVKIMDERQDEVQVVLEDDRKSWELLSCRYPEFMKRFSDKMEIPAYSNNELVEFGKQYANEQQYDIDEMGVLAFYTRIGEIQKDDRATTFEEIKKIIDDAISRSNKKKIGKLIDKLLSRRYNEDNLIILKEADFESK